MRYEKTFRTLQDKQTPWGTYVTMGQVNGIANNDDDDDDDDDDVHQATVHYLGQARSMCKVICITR
jgi:hypothetical protein